MINYASPREPLVSEVSRMSYVIVTSLSNLQNEVRYGDNHTLITDEPLEVGGEDAGPDPYTLYSQRWAAASP